MIEKSAKLIHNLEPKRGDYGNALSAKNIMPYTICIIENRGKRHKIKSVDIYGEALAWQEYN